MRFPPPVKPDVVALFTHLPFANESFPLAWSTHGPGDVTVKVKPAPKAAAPTGARIAAPSTRLSRPKGPRSHGLCLVFNPRNQSSPAGHFHALAAIEGSSTFVLRLA